MRALRSILTAVVLILLATTSLSAQHQTAYRDSTRWNELLEIGPVEGLTSIWHFAPKRTSVPLGSTLSFRATSHRGPIQWTGARVVEIRRGTSVATHRVDDPGRHVVSMEYTDEKGERAIERCTLDVVDTSLSPIQVSRIEIAARPLRVNEADVNASTMRYYFNNESIAGLQKLEDGHYVTSTNRWLTLEVRVKPVGFAPLIEWRRDSEPVEHLGATIKMQVFPPRTHSISSGLVDDQRTVRLDTYRAEIISHRGGDDVPEWSDITFRAVTKPRGFEEYVTWLASTKYGACEPMSGRGPEFTVSFRRTFGSEGRWIGVKADNAIVGSDDKTLNARFHYNSDGSLNGANVDDERGLLFNVGTGDVLETFKKWIADNVDLHLIAPISSLSTLDGIRPASVPSSDFGELTVYRFDQLYRQHEIVGPHSAISLSVDRAGRALAFTGTVVDPRISYSGLEDRISEDQAKESMLEIWRERVPDEFLLDTGSAPEPEISRIRLIAAPSLRVMGYQGQIRIGIHHAATVTVSAVNGEEIAYDNVRRYNPFDHRTVDVRAYSMSSDPDSFNQNHWIRYPGSTFGICSTFPPPIVNKACGCKIRMGDDRAAIYDFQNNNLELPVVWTADECFLDGSRDSYLDEDDDSTLQFQTQNVYQKFRSGLIVIDPKKAESGWDHAPGSPFGAFEEPPLSVFSNVASCLGSTSVQGWMAAYSFNEDWTPVEHPYPTTDFPTAAIALCNQDESVVFHELGHYYDLHSAYGFLGTGLTSSSCVWDTPDEARALAETVADLTAVYLYRDLYQLLPYDTSTTSSPCSFGPFGVNGRVHGDSCTRTDSEVLSFFEQRPRPTPTGECSESSGYDQNAVMQAFWEFVSGRQCEATSPYSCESILINPDRGMEAMLYAESLSNLQSYRQFFENMGVHILMNYGETEYGRYRDVMEHHDILEN